MNRSRILQNVISNLRKNPTLASSGESIPILNREQMHKITLYPLYNPEEITNLSDDAFLVWLEFIYHNPTKFDIHRGLNYFDGIFFDQDERMSLKWLFECWECEAHDRRKQSNIRAKYEEILVRSIENLKSNLNEEITFLSIGGGGLFQDLMILLNLFHRGYKNISLHIIEPNLMTLQSQILETIVTKLNNIENLHINININFYQSEESLPEIGFDAVYAIDSDIFYANKHVNLLNPALQQTMHLNKDYYYNILSVLFKGCSQLKPEHYALFLLTFGNSYYAFSKEEQIIHYNKIPQTKKLFEQFDYDYYCFIAHIQSLFEHINFLKQKGKPVLINENIINTNLKPSLELYLNANNIDFIFLTQEEITQKLALENATALVIDDLILESYEYNAFKNLYGNLKTLPVQFSNIIYDSYNEIISADLTPEYNVIRKRQLERKINTISPIILKDKILNAIEKYISWYRQNTFLRFSHLLHGFRGRERAIHLKSMLNNLDKEEDIENFIHIQLYNVIKKSSNSQHSLSRFIYAEIMDDESTHELNDEEYLSIRSGII